MPNKAALYHERTKHRFTGYAKGPDTLDWDLQPDPFRTFDGAERIVLPLAPETLSPPPGAGIDAIGALLHLSMGLSAWKRFGPDRWALRCNPSSGNLHPTEAYLLAENVAGLDDGLYHYVSRDHVLERRRLDSEPSAGAPCLWIGLSSIHWREAWKYGERAFRYCQLDLGHALGALSYAAQALSWRARLVAGIESAAVASLLGLDRDEDFGRAEREDPEALVQIFPTEAASVAPRPRSGVWSGTANRLDRHPMYRWPVIDEVAQATFGAAAPLAEAAPPQSGTATIAADLILHRRSAQHFNARHIMPRADFFALLDDALAQPSTVWPFPAKVHPILFVHRVEDVEPGLYTLPRSAEALASLRQALDPDFVWSPVEAAKDLPLFLLRTGDARGAARRLFCNQAIASDCCFGMAMLAEFNEVENLPWTYRGLHWEAGLVGQALYLAAERLGLRGTGVGCFFDDETHAFLGLKSQAFQTVYHFTIGAPMTDSRIEDEPAYPDKPRAKAFAP